MNFIIYDIILLIIFAIFVSAFLYRRRENIKKEGFLLLYKTNWGVRLIERIGKKHEKLLNFLSYVSVVVGFILMGTIIYLFGRIVWIYIFRSDIISLVKVPPIMPLLPYVPQIFQLDYLPAFYFIYWIIIIAIVAISHEVAHGIFAINKNVKIKTTGFGFFPYFLPVFLAAFVELDEKKMEKKKIFPQMAILSAGTFANVIVGILFLLILILFFSLAFSPSGVVYDTYMYSAVGLAGISSVNNFSIQNASYEKILNSVNDSRINEIIVNGEKYFATKSFIESQIENTEYILLYNDAPAIRAGLGNTIVKINEIEIDRREKLAEEILKYSAGEKVIITTLENDSLKDYEITFDESPEGNAYLGIGFLVSESSGILGSAMKIISSFKDSNLYYKQNFDGAEIIYNLLWWLVLISFSVALMNMLPVGIFDGGRFFYLAILAITKSKVKAKKLFSFMTYLFLFLLLVIMIFWGINLFR
ncbi:MAG: site-2 protease family protein [Candidatus Pacearchaeota archaeon]